MTVRLGTRGSRLALWQAEHVRQALRAVAPELTVEIVVLRTTGDRVRDVPLSRIGGTGVFTKEVDDALLSGVVDAAVHSLKDVPTRLAPGITLAAVLEREDPADALVVAPGRPPSLAGLPPGARVGTSSLRRRAQILAARPDLAVVDLRGNLDTRLARVAAGDYDAAIVALAGLRRLGREDAAAAVLAPPDWLPAVGQGALAVAVREGDDHLRAAFAPLDHAPTSIAVRAERAFLRTLQGGCQVPIGALAELRGDTLRLDGFIASLDGGSLIRGSREGAASDAEAIGLGLAEELLRRGGEAVVRDLHAARQGPVLEAGAP
jgi:hydroxymethylbilane synthase